MEAGAEALKELEKNPLKNGLGYCYTDANREQVRDFYVDCRDALFEFICPQTVVFGGNTSVRFLSGM